MIENIRTKDLADCIGSTQGFASQIKTGKRKLPIAYCLRVSERFNIPVSKLRPDIFEKLGDLTQDTAA